MCLTDAGWATLSTVGMLSPFVSLTRMAADTDDLGVEGEYWRERWRKLLKVMADIFSVGRGLGERGGGNC